MKKIVCLLLLIISSAVTGYFTAQILFGCRLTETLYFKTLFEPPPVYIELFFIIAPCALLMFLQKRFGLEQLTKAMVPALLLIPFFFFAYNFWTICAVIAIGSLCIFRLLLVLPAPKTIFSSDSKKYSLILLSIFTTIAIIQWIYLYDQSWKRQFMFFYDWGMFVEPALNTLRGDFMTEYWYNPGNSFLAHHFMPGFFIWFIPLMWLFPFPQTIMVVGALILGVSALLIFYFARQRKLPPVFAGLCGLLYLLYPTITNYNLSLFYGISCHLSVYSGFHHFLHTI
ncbi:MAG: DUF2079 domain-containing protein [Victivallaceae bacterium]|nr:DUF2079 domain-containing protein [Victivallaceae bacterium]